MSNVTLKGGIIGFEGCENYSLQETFGEASPFRLLASNDKAVSFVVVNPFSLFDDYTFELEDSLLDSLALSRNTMENIAILCIVRPDDETLYVNLRSPLIINTNEGRFAQVVLQNESYGVSVPFAAKKAEG